MRSLARMKMRISLQVLAITRHLNLFPRFCLNKSLRNISSLARQWRDLHQSRKHLRLQALGRILGWKQLKNRRKSQMHSSQETKDSKTKSSQNSFPVQEHIRSKNKLKTQQEAKQTQSTTRLELPRKDSFLKKCRKLPGLDSTYRNRKRYRQQNRRACLCQMLNESFKNHWKRTDESSRLFKKKMKIRLIWDDIQTCFIKDQSKKQDFYQIKRDLRPKRLMNARLFWDQDTMTRSHLWTRL